MPLLQVSLRSQFALVLTLTLLLVHSKGATASDDSGRSQPDGAQQLICSPASLNFMRVGIGSPATWWVTMKNTGSTSVTVSTMQANAPQFSVGHLNLPVTLGAGQSLRFTVTFAPTAQGSSKGDFAFDSNASNSVLYLPVNGIGVTNWALRANPPALQFGSVKGGQSATLPVSLTNYGSSSITITQDGMMGAEFSFSGLKLPLVLAGGQSFTFNVSFKPKSLGIVTGGMLASNPSAPVVIIPLSGTGTQPYNVNLSWNPSSSPNVGYVVYRSVGGAPFIRINASLDPTTSYTDNTVIPGHAYTYYAIAVDSSGLQSAPSNPVQVWVP